LILQSMYRFPVRF